MRRFRLPPTPRPLKRRNERGEVMPERVCPSEVRCPEELPVVAVDIGNARIKIGRFHPACWPQRETRCPATPTNAEVPGGSTSRSVQALFAPVDALSIDGVRPEFDQLAGWVRSAALSVLSWWIGSVNRPATAMLLDWLRSTRPQDAVRLLVSTDLPLAIRLPEPDRVGIDRLLDAVAANMLRAPGRPAVVVDVGTAITVDLVSADGAFCGGAILPGIAMSARALAEFTDLLPQVDIADLGEPPPLVGKSTAQAMRSGLFWSAAGAVRELASRMLAEQQPANGPPEPRSPSIFLTGGAAAAMAGLLGSQVCFVPHLTLAGIALTAQASAAGLLQGQPQPE